MAEEIEIMARLCNTMVPQDTIKVQADMLLLQTEEVITSNKTHNMCSTRTSNKDRICIMEVQEISMVHKHTEDQEAVKQEMEAELCSNSHLNSSKDQISTQEAENQILRKVK
jgi:hypothetical protein